MPGVNNKRVQRKNSGPFCYLLRPPHPPTPVRVNFAPSACILGRTSSTFATQPKQYGGWVPGQSTPPGGDPSIAPRESFRGGSACGALHQNSLRPGAWDLSRNGDARVSVMGRLVSAVLVSKSRGYSHIQISSNSLLILVVNEIVIDVGLHSSPQYTESDYIPLKVLG